MCWSVVVSHVSHLLFLLSFISLFPLLLPPILLLSLSPLRWLHQVALCHWDASMRQLSADALRAVAAVASPYLQRVTLPFLVERCLSKDVHVREGALRGCGRILVGMSSGAPPASQCETQRFTDEKAHASEDWSTPQQREALLHRVLAVPLNVVALRLLNGRGGDTVRCALSSLIADVSTAAVPLPMRLPEEYVAQDDVASGGGGVRGKKRPKPLKTQLQDIIDGNITHSTTEVQSRASEVISLYPSICLSLTTCLQPPPPPPLSSCR